MIFYKLPILTKKLQRLFGRLKTLIKLTSIKARYIIKVLDTEEKINHLEQVKNDCIQTVIKPKNGTVDSSFQKYLNSLEPTLIKTLQRVHLTVILTEMFDDCLSILTNKGLIQRNLDGWYVDFRNGTSATIKFMDIAIENLLTGTVVNY